MKVLQERKSVLSPPLRALKSRMPQITNQEINNHSITTTHLQETLYTLSNDSQDSSSAHVSFVFGVRCVLQVAGSPTCVVSIPGVQLWTW